MFLPTILTGGFLLIVGWVSGALDPELICAAIAAGIPGAALDIAHRRGFTDRHVHDRSRRGGFIALMAGCLVLAGVIAALRSTPRLLAAVLVGVLIIGAVARVWKISAHAAMAWFVGTSVAAAFPLEIIALVIAGAQVAAGAAAGVAIGLTCSACAWR